MKTLKKSCMLEEEQLLIEQIKAIIDDRPTYGYRRVHAVLNAKRKSLGLLCVNHKRVYRLMKLHDMRLPKYGRIKASRTHTGKIITLKSNLRWCSDGFTILCDNGEQVQVAFSLDPCDREVMRYIASTKGIDGQMIRDLMLETIEYRFFRIATIWLSLNLLFLIGSLLPDWASVSGFGRLLAGGAYASGIKTSHIAAPSWASTHTGWRVYNRRNTQPSPLNLSHD